MFITSILFQVKSDSSGISQYSEPGQTNGQLVGMGTYIRITSIWLYNTVTGEKTSLTENQYEDDALPANTLKYLFVDPGGYYVKKDDVNYIQNFRGNFEEGLQYNKQGYINQDTVGYYGPNINSPAKYDTIAKGTKVTYGRSWDDNWIFTLTPYEMWVHKEAITDTTPDSVTGYVTTGTGGNPTSLFGTVHNNNYSDIKDVNSTSPYTTPQRIIQGSGAENMLNDDGIQALIQSAGISNRKKSGWYDHFNRFGYIDPYNNVTTTKEFVFFTKPDLHIFEGSSVSGGLNTEIANIPIFDDAYYRYKPVLEQLQWSANKSNPFITILSNSIKSKLELPSISAEEIDTSANIYGTKMNYRKDSHSSDEAFDFSIDFEDTKYLEVYMLFKLFDEYERRKVWGEITPPDLNYVYRKILHDQMAIYKFIVSDDGTSLLYWAKLTGCYPKSVPREAFSDISEDSGIKFSVQWKAQFVEDMDPQILTDFNTVAAPLYNSSSTYLPIYNKNINAVDGRWAKAPFISQRQMTSADNIGFRYQLNWRI